MFIAASLGAIILLIVMRIAAIYGLRRVIIGLIILYLTGLLLFFNLNSPNQLVQNVMQYYPNVDRYFGNFIPAFVKFLPHNWVTKSLFWTVQNKFEFSVQFIILQLCTSILFFGIAVYLGSKWYYKSWLISSKLKIRKENSDSKKSFSLTKFTDSSSAKNSILKKDLLLFIREPSQVIHASVLLFLILIFVASVSSVNLMGAFNVDLQTILYLVVYLFNVLLISALSLRFVFPIISLEGKVFWKIKTAPITIKKYLGLRIGYPFFLIFLVAQALSFFLNFYFTLELTVVSAILTGFITIAIVFLNFGMGSIFAKYNEKSPIRIASSQGASLSFLLSIIYMILLVAVIFIPVYKYFGNYYRNTPFFWSDAFLPVLIISTVSIIIAFIFYFFAIKSLQKDY
jgi:ABC-2 type transport system permease protein